MRLAQRDIERARKRRHGLRADYGVGREELLKSMYYLAQKVRHQLHSEPGECASSGSVL